MRSMSEETVTAPEAAAAPCQKTGRELMGSRETNRLGVTVDPCPARTTTNGENKMLAKSEPQKL